MKKKRKTQREEADINVGGKSREAFTWKHANQVQRLIQQRGSDQLCPCFQEIE